MSSACSMKCNDSFLRGRSLDVICNFMGCVTEEDKEGWEISLVENVGIMNYTKITKLVSRKVAWLF